MVTFTKTGSTVKVDLGTEVHYLPTYTTVSAKSSSGKIAISPFPSMTGLTTFTFNPTDVNGRPSDVLFDVAEWLRDTFFEGSGGGGGGGTEYTEGATSTTITGTAVLWEDASDTLRTVSAVKPLPVNIVSGSSSDITISGKATSSVTSVAASASNVTVLASNASRQGALLFNDSTSSAYVKLGATATTSSFTIKMASNSYYELPLPLYTGIIDCIWDSATGNMRITEIS